MYSPFNNNFEFMALQNWIGRKTNPIQRYLRVSVTLQSFGV